MRLSTPRRRERSRTPPAESATTAARVLKRVMFLGETNAGKSTAARKFLASEGLAVSVLNDNTGNTLLPGFERVTWEEALAVKGCNLLVEDLIKCSDKEVAVLQKILSFNAHHEGIPTVVLIAHSSTNNGIFTLLQYLTHVCFMNKRTASKSLGNVLESYNFSRGERREKMAAFLDGLGRSEHDYWVLEVNTGKFERQPGSLGRSPGNVAAVGGVAGGVQPALPAADTLAAQQLRQQQEREGLLTGYRKTAETYLGLFAQEPKKALAIFDFVMAKTPLQSLSVVDLNFTLRDRKKDQVVNVSLLDYLHTLTTQTKPSRPVLDLHAYLVRYVTLPRCFIANSHPKLQAI